jgi:hypothetical protein
LCFQASASAATLFYASFLALQWQLLIIATFLFFGTLTFFLVLFDDTTNEVPASFTIQENNNENLPVET